MRHESMRPGSFSFEIVSHDLPTVLDVHMHGRDGSLGSANGIAATSDRGVTEASQGNSLAVTCKKAREVFLFQNI